MWRSFTIVLLFLSSRPFDCSLQRNCARWLCRLARYHCITMTERGMLPVSLRLRDALDYAAELHAAQKRKGGGVPYLAHLLSVSALAMERGANEDEAIAALLHDAPEDQGGKATLEAIRSRFGDTVAHIVDGCTDTYAKPKPPWRERKEAYIDHLVEADDSVLLVSACDKLHNARSILTDLRACGESIWDRFSGRKEGTLWYYHALVKVLNRTGPQPLAAELERVVGKIERLARNADNT